MKIHIIAAEAGVFFFSSLLNCGVTVKIYGNPSVKNFLSKNIKIKKDYISDRIQTLFLNSKPIDNIDNALLENGATLALSAAMPGTAGALFRKRGRYSAMRKQITYTNNIGVKKNKEGKIILKLFNMPAKELADIIFERGVSIENETLILFLKNYQKGLLPHIRSIYLDCKKKDKKIFFNKYLISDLQAINLKATFS
ncbi:MAG: hypothetical protein JRJ49_00655 [Deltaproteobacteria bacterium]|nr:hypothetical protein [Deltaproteobacteria bacterium]